MVCALFDHRTCNPDIFAHIKGVFARCATFVFTIPTFTPSQRNLAYKAQQHKVKFNSIQFNINTIDVVCV